MGSLLSFPGRLPFTTRENEAEVAALRQELASAHRRYAAILPVVRDLALDTGAELDDLRRKARGALKEARQ
jgi:hypothetical protein